MEFVSWDYYSQYMENNMFQTTNQYCMLDYQREREGMGWVPSIYGSVFVHYVNDVWQINTFLGV